MTVYCYDTEFLEDGNTIELISIGIVCEDGREYYAVNSDMDWSKALGHEWVRENVLPHLPSALSLRAGIVCATLDKAQSVVKPKWVIANEVRDFLRSSIERDNDDQIIGGRPELWAYYGAYDHVALAQLWGPMVDLPEGIPMYTNDIMQELDRSGLAGVDPTEVIPNVVEHHALVDACWNMQVLKALRAPIQHRPVGFIGRDTGVAL